MNNKYIMNLENLKIEMLEMANKAKSQLNYAFSLYFDDEVDKNYKIDPSIIDQFERKIEEECLNIILRERPFASDLRIVTGYFKVCEDIERLGDHSEDIEWCSKNLVSEHDALKIEDLNNMIIEAKSMVENSLKALFNGDVELANEVINHDDIIDKLYLKVLSLLPSLKKENKLNDNFLIYYTLVAKYVERIADHASNIAEWAVYIKNGYYKDMNIL